MHPLVQYEIARSRIDDEMRAADRRRLARAAAHAKQTHVNGPSILSRVWSLFAGETPRQAAAPAGQ